MSDESALWSDWGDGEHQINSEQPANEPAADPLPADASPADTAQLAADQEPAPEDAQQSEVPSEVDQAHIQECMQELQSTWGDAF